MEPTDLPYAIPDDWTLEKEFGKAWRMMRGNRRYLVKIRFDVDHGRNIAETLWHPTQTIEWEADGSCLFRCEVDGLEEIVWWVGRHKSLDNAVGERSSCHSMNKGIAIKTVPPIPVAFRRDRLTIPQVPAHAGPAIESLMDALRQSGVQLAGPVIFVYYGVEADPKQEFDLDICVPIPAEVAIPTTAPIGCKRLPAFECIAADFVGSMDGIGHAWREVAESWRASGRRASGESREVYKKWICFDSPVNVTELQKGIVASPGKSVVLRAGASGE